MTGQLDWVIADNSRRFFKATREAKIINVAGKSVSRNQNEATARYTLIRRHPPLLDDVVQL